MTDGERHACPPWYLGLSACGVIIGLASHWAGVGLSAVSWFDRTVVRVRWDSFKTLTDRESCQSYLRAVRVSGRYVEILSSRVARVDLCSINKLVLHFGGAYVGLLHGVRRLFTRHRVYRWVEYTAADAASCTSALLDVFYFPILSRRASTPFHRYTIRLSVAGVRVAFNSVTKWCRNL